MTSAQLQEIAPCVRDVAIQTFLPHLNNFMPRYEINTPLRQAAFISQILHESMCLKHTRELANGDAYEGRRDLGNTVKGDGRKYRGRGLLQITGRANYREVSKAIGLNFEKNPELLATPTYAVESACWFWNSRKLSAIADKPDTWRVRVRKGKPNEAIYDKFQYITYRINGALTHYIERKSFYTKALSVLA